MVELLPLEEVLFQEEPRAYLYRGKAYRSVTDRMKEAGLCEDFGAVPADRLEFAMRRGSMIHLACQYLDERRGLDWDRLDPRIEGYVRAHWRMREEWQVRPIAIEQPMVSAKYALGGRADVVYWSKGRRVLVDRKSGNSRKRRDGRIQTALYKILWDVTHPKQPIDARFIEKLYSNGTYRLVPCEDPNDLQAAMDLITWGETNDKLKEWKRYYGHAFDDDHAAGR